MTNGLLINEEHIYHLKNHGKTFIALSLDGHDNASNIPRFHQKSELLKKILENIDKIVRKEIPLMLLCTLNSYNIDKFNDYIAFIEEKYLNAIIKEC